MHLVDRIKRKKKLDKPKSTVAEFNITLIS